MSEQIKILGDKVAVESVTETQSLIHITDNNKWRYKVVAVGCGRKSEFGQVMTPPVSVGDIIIVDPNCIATIDVSGKTLKIVNSPDIIAKIS